MAKIKNEIGNAYGRLKVISFAGTKNNEAFWNCICVCGAKTKASGSNLRRKNTLSCGCYFREVTPLHIRKHGHCVGKTHSRTYWSWHSAKRRCTDSNNEDYESYGGRGIKLCKRWLKFKNFLKDMGERPIGTTLHRIDNDGNYTPGNCKWATPKEQANNRRKPLIPNKRNRITGRFSRSKLSAEETNKP